MSEFIDNFSLIWKFKLSLLPVIFAFSVFEGLTIIRIIFKIAYSPVYFLLFPLGHSDQLYSRYFNEDDLYIGESMSSEEKKLVRTNIISRSILSSVISTVINPFICGVFCAYCLMESEYIQFFYFLIFYKIVSLCLSLYRTRYISFVEKSGAWGWLLLIYIIYFVVILVILDASWEWTRTTLLGTELLEGAKLVLNYAIIDLGVYVIAAGAVGWAISHNLTQPELIPKIVDDEGFDD